jgi:phosphoglycerate dehydrogenase-like enzyme
MADVLFCTDTFWTAHQTQIEAIAPGIEALLLTGDADIGPSDLERITISYFSHDAWPERAASFFGVVTRAPNLSWFHTMSAGVDSPVFGSFLDRGVQLTTSSGTSAKPIARTVMMYLLALTRDLPRMMRAQAASEWAWDRWRELEGQRVAILGYGPIGQEVARLADAFGMEPVIVRRSAVGDEPYEVRPFADLTALAGEVDALVVALPLNDDTRGIVSADVMAAMGRHAFLVNVGRGELVDQPALVEALANGRLGGAGLDVTTPEPLPADNPLWSLPNVIITPHNSGSTDGAVRRADGAFLANLEHRVQGRPLANEVASPA